MTYNPNIPQPGDFLDQSQGQILTNFNQANTIFGIDHVAFDGGADAGKHTKVTITQRVAGPGSLVNELVLYQKAVAGSSELFFQRDGVATEIPLTGLPITTVGTIHGITTPWGIILNWGTASIVTGANDITFAVPFNNTNYAITVSSGSLSLPIAIGAKTNTKVTVSVSGNTTCNFIVIGN